MDENKRLASLQRYKILGTLPEKAFDEIAALAGDLCEAPIAMISFVDSDCVWFKAQYGSEIQQVPRNQAFCHYTIKNQEVMVVEDAWADDRFKDLAYVKGGRRLRFYAGAPLICPEGNTIGTLCILDSVPRSLLESQQKTLQRLANLVMQFLEVRVADLGEKQRAQSDLEKQKEFLDAVLENLADGVVACDSEGRVHLFNESCRRFHGLDANVEIAREDWPKYYQIYQSDGVTLLEAQDIPLARAFDGAIVKNHEIVVATADGKARRRLLCQGRAFFDKQGKKIGAVVTMADVTEMENALARENAASSTLTKLIDLAPVAITMLDKDNRITVWNKASEEITGWKQEELLGKTIYEGFAGNDSNSQRINKTVNEKVESFSSEMEYTTKHGKKVDLQVTVVPIFDGDGNQSGSMGVSVNISDIRERERRLVDANKVLKEASAAKSDFLANMSHEIRTPLNGVIAMSELVMMTPLDEAQRDMMGTVQASANNLLTILSLLS